MTNSEVQVQPERGGKRERLVASAQELLHQQGVETTTLAQIAQLADVPPGNVYYYFKTKDEIVDAAIAARTEATAAMLASLERHRTPKARLKALTRALTEESRMAARYGCPDGTLCSELDKREGALQQACARLMEVQIGWAEQQFRLMGRSDARDLALTLIAAYQGIALLTNTFRDPELMARERRRLERWIDSLA
jgi:AcrR family transcriptional regulator